MQLQFLCLCKFVKYRQFISLQNHMQETDWDPRYMCFGEGEFISWDKAETVVQVQTEHLKNYTNRDVKAVKLQRKRIKFIPRGLKSTFPNMNELYLFHSQLEQIQRSSFKELKDLFALSFYNNRISLVTDDAFADLKELRSLSISSNKLEKLPDRVFQNLLELERIYLNSNFLQFIPASLFEKNIKLKVIFLHYNQLFRLAPFKPSMDLTTLNLKGNTCIDVELSNNFPLQTINKMIVESCSEKFCGTIDDDINECATELYQCRVDEALIKKENTDIKNKQRRFLIL